MKIDRPAAGASLRDQPAREARQRGRTPQPARVRQVPGAPQATRAFQVVRAPQWELPGRLWEQERLRRRDLTCLEMRLEGQLRQHQDLEPEQPEVLSGMAQ